MKIFLLNGSPRGGKSVSLSLSRNFIDGLQQARKSAGAAPATLEEAHLATANIQSCRGCFACWRNEGHCIIQDEMASLLPGYLGADLVVWSMPLYHFGMPAIMKTFLERTLPECEGSIIPDGQGAFTHPQRQSKTLGPAIPPEKSAPGLPANLLISTCGFPSTKNNYEPLDAHFNQLFGHEGWEKIQCIEGELFNVPELHTLTNRYRDGVLRAGMEWGAASAQHSPWTGFSATLAQQLKEPMMDPDRFIKLANTSWGQPAAADVPLTEHGNAVSAQGETLLTQMCLMYNTAKAPAKPALLEIEFTDQGQRWHLQMDKAGCQLLPPEPGTKADCKITTDYPTWVSISRGETDGAQALMEGRYKVSGDTSLIMRMGNGLFDGGAAASAQSEEPAKTAQGNTMFWGLFPWLVGWIGLPMAPLPYQPAVLAIAVLLANLVLWQGCRQGASTWMERMSPIFLGCVLGLSLVAPSIILPYGPSILYLASAILWALSCVKKPLTSDYSERSYSDEIAQSQLFISTNRIITLFWAVIYLAMALLILVLLNTPVAGYASLLVQVALIPAALFTRWFPNWYPEWKMGR
jgi:putative sterol carrier protein